MINILLSGDFGVVDGIELVLYTLLTHTKHCRIFLLTMNITIRSDDHGGFIHYPSLFPREEYLKSMVKYLDSTSELIMIDASKYYQKYFEGNPNEIHAGVWLSPFTVLRLASDIIFPDLDHLLYLDADTAIMKDIRPMYEMCKQSNCTYAAHIAHEAKELNGEMVAGVLFFNMNKVRETKILEAARKNVKENVYEWYDQGALSATGIKPYRLDDTYAFMYDLYALTEMPTIIHFTNGLDKVYNREISGAKAIFYRKYSFLNYVKEGLDTFFTVFYPGKGGDNE